MITLAAFSISSAGAEERSVAYLDQGWSPEQRAVWYTLSQGSRLLPLDWLRALEQPGSSDPFLTRGYIEEFRYLWPEPAAMNQLPIGFAIDTQSDRHFSDRTRLRWKAGQADREPWVGLNCAACHTAELTYQGRRFRINGGPTLADFQSFISALNRSLIETRNDSAKFDRFAQSVLGIGERSKENLSLLKNAMDRLIKWQLEEETANKAAIEYGFGRLDAFGHIYNKILLSLRARTQLNNPADAPVSYPFLWNTHQQDKVQWNGIAANTTFENIAIGALGRNVGEVTGVFADLKLFRFGPAVNGYVTSARLKNLMRLEGQLAQLKPPSWPDAFPTIDVERWERGKALFLAPSGGCVSCHSVIGNDDLTTSVNVEMTKLSGEGAIGTDPWMACNAYTYQAYSGILRGTPRRFIIFSSSPFEEKAPLADLLSATVVGSIYYKRTELLGSVRAALKASHPFLLEASSDQDISSEIRSGGDVVQVLSNIASMKLETGKVARLQRCMTEKNALLAYKARPLTGIWATPPFLHNGSVPTLYDLLLPPESRPRYFSLGTREFDPEKVGYVNEFSGDPHRTPQAIEKNIFQFRAFDGFGAEIPGNSNAGHDYGNRQFSDEDRWALVEYMKAVGGHRDGNRIAP
ncbi:Uncharacterized protein ToN1_48550 [Aromatoleum petrolei]|nr:Uncharacterized protein ToN1_48550 [Aromatoleum petrolei]